MRFSFAFTCSVCGASFCSVGVSCSCSIGARPGSYVSVERERKRERRVRARMPLSVVGAPPERIRTVTFGKVFGRFRTFCLIGLRSAEMCIPMGITGRATCLDSVRVVFTGRITNVAINIGNVRVWPLL